MLAALLRTVDGTDELTDAVVAIAAECSVVVTQLPISLHLVHEHFTPRALMLRVLLAAPQVSFQRRLAGASLSEELADAVLVMATKRLGLVTQVPIPLHPFSEDFASGALMLRVVLAAPKVTFQSRLAGASLAEELARLGQGRLLPLELAGESAPLLQDRGELASESRLLAACAAELASQARSFPGAIRDDLVAPCEHESDESA